MTEANEKMATSTQTDVATEARADSKAMPKLTPRQMRACTALFARPMMREELDRAAGCSNAPDLVARLIAKGIGIKCIEVKKLDRDGRATWPGRYELTEEGRATLQHWGWGVVPCMPLLGEASMTLITTD